MSTRRVRILVLLLVLPALLVAPGLLPGRRLLPVLPCVFEPFASEAPAAARAARERENHQAVERVTTLLVDDLSIREHLRAGEWPAWEPRLGLGRPLAAGTQHGAWYPPNALSWILPADVAPGWEALIALFLAGAWMHLFLASRALPGYACVFGAWAFQSGGFALLHLHQPMQVDSALWLPLALHGVERLVARRRFGGLVLSSSIAGTFLAGCLPIAVWVTASMLAYALWRGFSTRDARVISRGGGWITAGFLAATIAWWPALEARHETLAARADPARSEAQALPAASLLTLLVPDLFGAPADSWPTSSDALAWQLARTSEVERVRNGNAPDWSLYAGIAVLVLSAAAALARPRESACALVPLALALAFALSPPVVSWLARVPGFDLGTPAQALCIAWTAWPVLAAIGLRALVEAWPRATWTAFGAGLALALLGGVAALAFDPGAMARDLPATLAARHGVSLASASAVVPREQAQEGFVRAKRGSERLALAGLCAAVAVLGTRLLRRTRPLVACAPWFALAALEGLLLAQAHLAPQDLGQRAILPESEAIEAIRAAAGDGRVVRFDAGADETSAVADLARPNLLAAGGIAELTPAGEATPRRLLELLASIDPRGVARGGVDRLTDPRTLALRTLDLLRVTCVLSRAPLRDPRLRLVLQRPGFCVHARLGSLARARVVPGEAVVAQSAASALQLLADEGYDPRRAVVIAAEDLPPEQDRPHSSPGPFRPGEIQVASPASDRVEVRVSASSGGWLVLHEQAFPGWKARVNGRAVPCVPADHVYRAVAIPAGDSLVEMVYAPDSLRLGAWISIGAALAAVLFALRRARRPGE